MNVLELLNGAVRELGALGLGEALPDDEAQDALQALNDMMGTWRTESLMIYGNTSATTPLVSGQNTYTVGVGADVNTTNNTRILSVYVRSSNNIDFPVYTTTNVDEYASIRAKTITTSLPNLALVNYTHPNREIVLWPVPSDESYTLVVWLWDKLLGFTSLTETVSLPDGYARALRTNLAIDLAARYGKPVSDALAKTARESKAQIKRFNSEIPLLSVDPVLSSAGQGFNYYTGRPM